MDTRISFMLEVVRKKLDNLKSHYKSPIKLKKDAFRWIPDDGTPEDLIDMVNLSLNDSGNKGVEQESIVYACKEEFLCSCDDEAKAETVKSHLEDPVRIERAFRWIPDDGAPEDFKAIVKLSLLRPEHARCDPQEVVRVCKENFLVSLRELELELATKERDMSGTTQNPTDAVTDAAAKTADAVKDAAQATTEAATQVVRKWKMPGSIKTKTAIIIEIAAFGGGVALGRFALPKIESAIKGNGKKDKPAGKAAFGGFGSTTF